LAPEVEDVAIFDRVIPPLHLISVVAETSARHAINGDKAMDDAAVTA
jgi:hypothetical protein